MEVSGRRLKDSESADVLYCEPCQNIQDQTTASNYCIDCNEFLCAKCTVQHKMSKLSKRHTILDKHEMPKMKLSDGNICPKDGDIVKYYCEVHEEFCCTTCFTDDHGKCGVVNIKTMAERFETSFVYRTLRSNINSLFEQINYTKDCVDDIRKAFNENSSGLISEIQQSRSDINATLDTLETKIQQDVEDWKSKNDATLDSQQKQLTTIEDYLTEIISRVREQERYHQNELLVISTTKANTYLHQYQDVLDNVKQSLDTIVDGLCYFNRNKKLDELQSLSSFGTIETITVRQSKRCQRNPLSGIFEGNIDVKHCKDTKDCWVTGCTELDDDILAIADQSNNSVKLVDIECNEITSYITLPSPPWDITRVNGKLLVVTCDDNLTFLKVTRRLKMSIEREVHIDGICSGIEYRNGDLVVSYTEPNPAVKVLSTDGNILQTFSAEEQFISPFYLTTGTDARNVFVADYDSNMVTLVDADGVVNGTYKDANLIGPYGLTDDGNAGVFIVGCKSSNVHQITSSCELIGICLDEEDGIESPQAIAYCRASDKLVLSHNQFAAHSLVNTLSVYKIQRNK